MDDAAPITPFAGFSYDRIDDAVVNPDLYANDEIHVVFRILRETEPVRFMRPTGFRPFWSITKHADVMEVERRADIFVNRLRTYLSPIAGEEHIMQLTGDTHLFRTLVDIDDPQHMKLRQLTQGWFMPPNLKRLEPRIAEIAKAHVDRMQELGGACDFVKEVAVWYPLRVIMEILGVPKEDEPFMLRLTQEIFGSGDPDVAKQSERAVADEAGGRGVDLMQTAQVLFQYFGKLSADRRANPTDDVATIIANAKIDGAPLSDLEALSYYVIIATAGHDTTSSVTAGGLLQLIENPGELRKLKADPSLLSNAVEEMIRWVTPVQHFMRTAMEDYTLRGRTIKAGDGLCLHYPSANRDEEVFEEPFKFRVDRPVQRQLAFGFGPHLCLGMHLARMEIKALFAELLPRLEEIELAGEPKKTRSNFVSGLKTLPIRYKMTAEPKAAPASAPATASGWSLR
jgi:cytochrome P450